MPTPTADKVERYLDLQKRKREHNRQADALEREEKQLGAEFFEYLDGKQKLTCTIAKRFVLSIGEGASSVSWKDEFERIAGAEKAAEVLTGAPKRRKLNVVDLLQAEAA